MVSLFLLLVTHTGLRTFLRSKSVRRSSRKTAISFANCEVSSTECFSQPFGTVEKQRGAEFPVTNKKEIPNGISFFVKFGFNVGNIYRNYYVCIAFDREI